MEIEKYIFELFRNWPLIDRKKEQFDLLQSYRKSKVFDVLFL